MNFNNDIININSLENINIGEINQTLYGLNYENSYFEFMSFYNEKKKLLVFFSGALKDRKIMPLFNRISWNHHFNDEYNLIYFQEEEDKNYSLCGRPPK